MDLSGITGISPNQTSYEKVGVKDKTSLSMDDFFKLIAAQLQNQNMMDPVDNTEFVAQMAQFSTLSQMQELSSSFQMTYAVSLIGKNVNLNSTDKNGVTLLISGIVDEVAYQDGIPYVKIDDNYYDAKSILTVKKDSSESKHPAEESSKQDMTPVEKTGLE